MTWLLNLFPSFQRLRSELHQEQMRAESLESANRELRRQVNDIEERHHESDMDRVNILKTMINLAYQERHGFVMFPESRHMPTVERERNSGPIEETGFQSPQAFIAQETQSILESFRAEVEEDAKRRQAA